MDPLTLTIVGLVAIFFFGKKKKKKTGVSGKQGLTVLNVTNTAPPLISQSKASSITVDPSSVVVLALPSDWRGTASYQGILWEAQGSPDGPDFMFRRDPDWDGDAYFVVDARNSHGQTTGRITVQMA